MMSNRMPCLQQLLLRVPRGKVTTYKALANAMGTRGCRAVGRLLGRNPEPDRFPCFKVVRSDGRLGGFSLGKADKIRRLEKDGISVKNGRIEDFEARRFLFC